MRVVIAREPGFARERLRQNVLGMGLICAGTDCVPPADLPARLLEGPADLILFGLDDKPARRLPLLQQAAAHTPLPIFAVGPTLDAELILQVLRCGAREYLHEDALYDELLTAVGKLQKSGAGGLRWGHVLAVIAAKPGAGVTTISCNLAFALAAHYPNRVVLAELAAGVPELALDLDLRPPHNLAELVAERDRLDATILRQALVGHPARLSVLAHPPDVPFTGAPDPAAMRQVLVLLRTMFDFTVLDLGHVVDATRTEALALAHKVVLVVNLDVPSLRLGRQFIHQLEDVGVPKSRLHVVANRYGQRRQFHWKRAQEALSVPILEWVPDDAGRVNDALNTGQPLLHSSRRTAIARSFERLAEQLGGSATGQPRGLAV